ncbi:MAG TPA: hypothetical protein VGI58_14260 [Streptosporangiaceae bacterium]|jgi:hypothetical protein
MRDLTTLTAGDFEAVVGSDFTVIKQAWGQSSTAAPSTRPENTAGAAPIGPMTISLGRVVPMATRVSGHRLAFSLRFHGPADPALGQGIHRLAHAQMGELDIFLVPIAADQYSRSYEAVFG